MTIRRKTLIITGITSAGLLAVLYLTSHVFLQSSFRQLQAESEVKNVQRALGTLEDVVRFVDRLRNELGQAPEQWLPAFLERFKEVRD